MPQNDGGVSEKLASAKSFLASSTSKFPSPKALAAPAPKAAASAAKTAVSGAAGGIGAELAAKKPMVEKAAGAANVSGSSAVTTPKMHDGGPVLTDGDYNLKAGEHVLTAPQAKMVRKHALMAVGMKRGMSTPATAGEPTKMDAAHKKPEKPIRGIVVRPEKNQSAQIKDRTKKN